MRLVDGGSHLVLFIHGFFGNIETFRDQGEFLKKHGISYALVTYPHDDFTFEDFIDCIVEKLVDRGINRFSILGTSMGGFCAQLFAARYNSRIDSLILTNTFSSTTYFKRKNRLITAIAPFLPEGLIKFYLKNVAKKEYGGYEDVWKLYRMVDSLTKKDVLARVKALTAIESVNFEKRFPVAVLDSADDVTIPDFLKSELKFVARPDFEYTFPSGGHFPYIFRKQEFNQILLQFIEDVYAL